MYREPCLPTGSQPLPATSKGLSAKLYRFVCEFIVSAKMYITRQLSVHTSKTDLSVLFSHFFSVAGYETNFKDPAEKESLTMDAVQVLFVFEKL